MLNVRSLLKNYVLVYNHQSIRRMGRKPFWLGIAKTKMFVVREKQKLPDAEEKEFTRLKGKHRIIIDSLLHFLRHENPLNEIGNHLSEKNTITLNNDKLNKEIEESFLKNDHWNTESAKFRNARLDAELEKMNQQLELKISKREESTKQLTEKVNEIVRQEKLISHTYITMENLDEAVQECLKNIVDYNYAIDIQGNKYPGRETIEKTICQPLATGGS